MPYSQSNKIAPTVLPDSFAICQFAPGTHIPSWVFKSSFLSVVKTDDEISVVCDR